MISTAITEIFGGSTLDVRTVNKDKDSCGNRQPFFALQLDIKVLSCYQFSYTFTNSFYN